MTSLIVNEKYAPPQYTGADVFFLEGLTTETETARITPFQHPTDAKKQGLIDDIKIEPKTYACTCFVGDNSQGFLEQFENWGKKIKGNNGDTFSLQFFSALKELIGVVVDVDNATTGNIETMLVTDVTATRGATNGLNITIDMQEVLFAESTRQEDYVPAEEPVQKKTKKKKDAGKAKTETGEDKNQSWLIRDLGL